MFKTMSRTISNLKLTSTTKIHLTALDGIGSVNSLFTLGLFLGLTWSPPSAATALVENPACAASSAVAENLVSFHVYSFSSFLFSSLVALALKQTIRSVDGQEARDIVVGGVANHERVPRVFMGHINLAALRVGTLVSGLGSVSGCGFLTMALVDLVQIKLGSLGCESFQSWAAVGPLVVLVPSALVFYLGLVLYAFTR